MKHKYGVLIALFGLITLSTQSIIGSSYSLPQEAVFSESMDLLSLATQLDVNQVLSHSQVLSNFGSRVTGYIGFFNAADYIKDYWRELDIPIIEESFSIASPITYENTVDVLLDNGSQVDLEAYPLWPNQINPCPYESPPEGDRLVYVGEGDLSDFNNITVKDSFALLEFNDRWYWKFAVLFGAKGVIFLEPNETTTIEAVEKTFGIPLNLPRLYVRGDAATLLRSAIGERGETCRIWVHSFMKWESKQVANLVAVFEGVDQSLKDEIAIIGAYYDSWSIVPQLSPGATDSLGISFLLELSRLFKANPPQRTVWLIAFAGHYQALSGAREFVENHFKDLGSKIKMFVSLDLASDSDILAAYATGITYGYSYPTMLASHYRTWVQRIFYQWLPELESDLGTSFSVIDGIQYSYPLWIGNSPPFEPFFRAFEAEVFTEACYGGGMGFVTTNALRIYQYTPLDTFEKINSVNLKRQVTFLWPILFLSANMPIDYFIVPARCANDWGVVTTVLQLAQYNESTDWFDQIVNEDALFFVSVGATSYSAGTIVAAGFTPPEAIGPSRSVVVQGASVGLYVAASAKAGQLVETGMLSLPIGFTVVVKPDEHGRAIIKGIRPYTGIDVQGYVLDQDGGIVYATDTGPFGASKVKFGGLFGAQSAAAAPILTPTAAGLGYLALTGPLARTFSVYTTEGFQYVPVFKTASIAIVGVLDSGNIEDTQALTMEVYNFLSHSWFVWRDVITQWPEAMAFIEPNAPTEVVIKSGGKILAVLNNASADYPEGFGYTVKQGDSLILSLMEISENMYYLSLGRAGMLASKMVANLRTTKYLETMEKYRNLALQAETKNQNSFLYSYSVGCWQYALAAYLSSFDLLYDTVTTVVFFFFLSLPFTFLLERSIAKKGGGRRRTITLTLLFLGVNAALSLVHPGYFISSNVFMLINGLAVIVFSIILFGIVLDEFNLTVKSLSKSILGLHKAEIERSAMAMASLFVGVENLKKRKLRTALILTTIMVTVTAMTLFTTTSVSILSYKTVTETDVSYTGMLIKRPFPDAVTKPVSESYLLALDNIVSRGIYKVSSAPRSWIYPPGLKALIHWNPENTVIIGILAISPEEYETLKSAVMPGGRTFLPDDVNAVLISDRLAEALSKDIGVKVNPGFTLQLWGIPLSVKGILSEEVFNSILPDMDQNKITLPDPVAVSLMQQTPSYLPVSNVLIVPYEFAKKYLNAQPNAIPVIVKGITEDSLYSLSFELSLILRFDVFYGHLKDEAYQSGVVGKAGVRDLYSFSGGENIIMPVLLSALTLLTTVLGAVKEREKEISVLSTIGLSPSHISNMFLMEIVSVSFIGSYLGYLVGAAITYLIWNIGIYPEGLLPNVSSVTVVTSIVIMMLATILSSIYPLIKASRIATPSLVRKWRVSIKPVGDFWNIDMPFKAPSDEALGILYFLKEFFEASSIERGGIFMVLTPVSFEKDGNDRSINTRLQLTPFDAGIIQEFTVSSELKEDMYEFKIIIHRIGGIKQVWLTSNTSLLDRIRKQFLLWRTLRPEEKSDYVNKASKEWAK